MAITIERDVFTVQQRHGQWVVEHRGEFFDACTSIDEAKASAQRRARRAHDEGRPCQVRVNGDVGYFGR